MRSLKCCAPLLLVSATALSAHAQDASVAKNAALHMASMLANDARDALRNPALPPQTAVLQANVLLQFAAKLDPADLRVQRLLAETARIAGKADIQKEALRTVIAADPGDLVSQVHYIDLLAGASQTVEERATVYQGALQEKSLDRQIRSEVAARLAGLAEGRGDTAQARDFLSQAVQLNDVNVGALRDLVRLAASDTTPDAPSKHLRALAALLLANPYQADAWLQMARLCEAAGLHDRAVEFLETAGEQLAIDGMPTTGDFRLELALEYGIAGQRVHGYNMAQGLAALPDAPLAALLVAELLSQNITDAGTPASPPATQPAFVRLPEIRKRLTELARQTDNPSALADAAGADLTIMAKPGSDTPAWIDAYASLVKPDDATLARLRGWSLYRQGKLDEARTTLDKIAASDPLAQVGVARILFDQGNTTLAGSLLRELWSANPTGLLALQVALAAQKAKITLPDSTTGTQMRLALARLTPAVSGMHRHPRDAQFIEPRFRKDAVGGGIPALGAGEPVWMQIRITNTTERPVPVGADGVVKPIIGLAGAARGAGNAALGLYAIEDLQRVYRLDPHQMMEATIRVDQGKLADLFEENPGSSYDVSITLVTAPRVLGATEYSVGVGGQVVFPGDFRHAGLSINTPAETDRLVQEIASFNGDRQLLRIEAAGALLAGKNEALKPRLAAALAALTVAPEALVRAALVRALPTGPVAGDLEKNTLAGDADPLVRLMWAARAQRIALAGGERATTAAALQSQAEVEKDPRVKEWLGSTLALLKASATKPANPTP